MKTRKLHTRLLKWLCALLLALVITATCFGCSNTPSNNGKPEDGDSSQNQDPPLWASNFNLPDKDVAYNKLIEIYGGADKVFLLNSNVARMPCPQGQTVTINATFEVNEYAKLVLEDSIAEFNEVFAVINPNYTFAINYNPTEDDLSNKYSVEFSASSNLAVTETSQVFGVAHVGYYNDFTELGDFGITIKTEVFNNGSYLMTTFKHELMHLLGAGDAYKNSSATKATVMQSYTVGGYHHFSKTDVAFLDALYRNPEFNEDDARINGYINSYEETTTHTRSQLTATVYNKLVADLKPQVVINQANEIGYKDLTDFIATINNGITCDTAFGSENISFKEIEYAETPSETYFGSIEPQNNRYWHGRQTSLGSSQGIGYVDYGNGILYSAPNGNQYMIMIKTGDFVLAFRLSGSFTNFADLSLNLWHISK